jgi:hypothetical protein
MLEYLSHELYLLICTMNTHKFKLIKMLIECVYEKYRFLQEQIISYLIIIEFFSGQNILILVLK